MNKSREIPHNPKLGVEIIMRGFIYYHRLVFNGLRNAAIEMRIDDKDTTDIAEKNASSRLTVIRHPQHSKIILYQPLRPLTHNYYFKVIGRFRRLLFWC